MGQEQTSKQPNFPSPTAEYMLRQLQLYRWRTNNHPYIPRVIMDPQRCAQNHLQKFINLRTNSGQILTTEDILSLANLPQKEAIIFEKQRCSLQTLKGMLNLAQTLGVLKCMLDGYKWEAVQQGFRYVLSPKKDNQELGQIKILIAISHAKVGNGFVVIDQAKLLLRLSQKEDFFYQIKSFTKSDIINNCNFSEVLRFLNSYVHKHKIILKSFLPKNIDKNDISLSSKLKETQVHNKNIANMNPAVRKENISSIIYQMNPSVISQRNYLSPVQIRPFRVHSSSCTNLINLANPIVYNQPKVIKNQSNRSLFIASYNQRSAGPLKISTNIQAIDFRKKASSSIYNTQASRFVSQQPYELRQCRSNINGNRTMTVNQEQSFNAISQINSVRGVQLGSSSFLKADPECKKQSKKDHNLNGLRRKQKKVTFDENIPNSWFSSKENSQVKKTFTYDSDIFEGPRTMAGLFEASAIHYSKGSLESQQSDCSGYDGALSHMGRSAKLVHIPSEKNLNISLISLQIPQQGNENK